MTETTKIAIVGAGPRGLALAERLRTQAGAQKNSLSITFYDPNESFGAGPNFNPDDSDLSLLNMPAYEVELEGDDEGQSASFPEWYKKNGGKSDEAYPPRSTLGKWLEERFANVKADKNGGEIKTVSSKVEKLEKGEDGWTVTTEDGKSDTFTHVVLAVAQPESTPDRAMARWLDHAEKGKGQLVHAYPAKELGKAASKWKGKTVAVRGLGLSTLDALRQLTLAQGGSFSTDGYKASGKEAEAIYLFSKDGVVMHPKPDGRANDARYDVSEEELSNFEDAIKSALSSQPKDALAVVFAALNAPTTRILESFEAAPRSEAIHTWLQQEEKQPGSQQEGELTDVLAKGIAMAKGEETPDVGYVLGQVWRKFNDRFSQVFDSTVEVDDETRKNLVAFDEGFKRYSYGPPVETLSELKHLIDSGLVKVELANDPTVSITDNGWKLRGADNEVEVIAMVDAVIPPSDLSAVSDSAIAGLRDEGTLSANALGGVQVMPCGQVIDKNGEKVEGLFLIGRLALGNVIGVDTLPHCFGEGTTRTANSILGIKEEETEEAA